MYKKLFFIESLNKVEEIDIPFQKQLKYGKPLVRISEEVSQKLLNLFSKNLSIQNKQNQTFHIIYINHETIIKKQIFSFFAKNFQDDEPFLTKLNNFFYKNILAEYEEILKMNTTIYKFTQEEIGKHIDLIKEQY